MSQFQVSYSEKEKAIEKNLQQAKKQIFGSTQIGIETIESLRSQSEKLDATEQKLEDTDHLIAQSVRSLRGMTWSGTFYNAWSDAASMLAGPVTRNTQLETESSSKSSSSSMKRDLSTHRKESNQPLYFTSKDISEPQSAFDQDLNEISHALETLRAVGITLNEQLEQQNEQLDRIEASADRVNDKTLSVTLRTTKVSERTSHDPGKLIGSFQFVAPENGMLLLGADGECAVLTNSADTATIFDVYLRYDTIVGLCNKRTGKYLGKTMWGGISVAGMYFGSMEEWYFDFSSEQSALLCLSKNWGAGGWLRTPGAEQLREDDQGVIRHILDSTTTSVRDRKKCIVFRALFISGPPTNK
jgi:hypothetical protein